MALVSFISRRFNARKTLPASIRAMRAVAIAGIAVAVAALVVATSIGRGFESRYRRALLDFNAHVIVMGSGELEGTVEVSKPGVVGQTPFLYREALAVGGGRITGLVVKGVDPQTMGSVNAMPIRLFEPAASLEEALSPRGDEIPTAVAGRALANQLGAGEGPREVKLLIPREGRRAGDRDPFVEVRIVGTFESGMHDYDAQFLLMSLPSARRLFRAAPTALTGIELKLDDPDKADAMATALEEDLGPRVSVVTWGELNRDLLTAVRLEQLVSSLIMGIMVIVAALNIVAVLVLMTIYRLREISVLKALGTPDRSIEALLARGGISLGVWGAGLGLAIGVGAALALGRFGIVPLEAEIYLISAVPIDISPVICGIIAIFCVGVGYATSKLASRRLAVVPIAEGLQIAR